MNFLFEFHNTYTVSSSVEDVVADLKGIKQNWWNLAKNITGRIRDDGTFTLYPKWTFGYVDGFRTRLYYLEGTITNEDGETKIKTVARPNYGLVIAFYACPAMLILRLFGIHIVDGPLDFMVLMALVFPAVLFPVMVWGAMRLRYHFEEHMQITREQ